MEQRHQFVLLAKSGEFTVTDLCERFGIARKTAHKWTTPRLAARPYLCLAAGPSFAG